MPQAQRESVYDKIRPHLDASDLLSRLNITVERTIGSEAYCRPLCHESAGGESLQINLHTGRWNCKACQSAGVFGDLFQLVEYSLTGGRAPSHGVGSMKSDAHRAAIEWLCEQYGIPFKGEMEASDPALDVVHLFAMAAHQHLLANETMLAWIQERWGFDRDTVEQYGIGYLSTPLLPMLVNESKHAESKKAFKRSGIGWYDKEDTFRTRFEGRITFPYLEHGRTVYLIGRATDWTPKLDDGRTPPKYHKLAVHSETRPHVSERITNDHLFNEPVMEKTDVVVIAEGITDAIALSTLGVPVVSPVTISFNEKDRERFIRKSRERGIRRVEILFDNELSGSGNFAARRVGRQLIEGGLAVRILTIPLGDSQRAARDEVLEEIGPEAFEAVERAEPHVRKTLLAEAVPDPAKREWINRLVSESKVDVADWYARTGAGAAGRFEDIRRKGEDLIELEITEIAKTLDAEKSPVDRAAHFHTLVELIAWIDEGMMRDHYAGLVSQAAGKGVTKVEIAKRINAVRRQIVKPKRKEEKEEVDLRPEEAMRDLVLLPPDPGHAQPAKKPTVPADPSKPAPPPPPGEEKGDEHTRYASVRDAVARSVDAKVPHEILGEYVADTVTRSMGFTAFRTPDDLHLIRGNERIAVGADRRTAQFKSLMMCAAGLTAESANHRPYLSHVFYFLERGAIKVNDVSWSHVDKAGDVFFSTGELSGRMVRIGKGSTKLVRMGEVKIPAVAGGSFLPFNYTGGAGGIARVAKTFEWTSLSAGDRLLLLHWTVCLPVLRRIGTIPIMRIEGGSSSGKTRAVSAISILVNGQVSTSVPTSAAMISRMAVEMLTVDDNREAKDVTPALMGTLLQATHLGAREKRKGNSDTGTVVERICGALLMNGVEPIHDGATELASRMIVLRSDMKLRKPGSPTSETILHEALLDSRSAFWSESVRVCGEALKLDAEHGEALSDQIDVLFGATKVGRLSAYLRMMYLSWVVLQPEAARPGYLDALAPAWVAAFDSTSALVMTSLVAEELTTTALHYAFAYGRQTAEKLKNTDEWVGLDGKYARGEGSGKVLEVLGPLSARHLARFVRTAGRELNGPDSITRSLRAGQLENRILDSIALIEGAGYEVQVDHTNKGRARFTFTFRGGQPETPPGHPEDGSGSAYTASKGDTWSAPGSGAAGF